MQDRAAVLDTLQSGKLFDLLVIGGGATGCGVALDAATRGLKVALAEKGDFGSGTSGRSTKLIHGGVRYLERALLHFDRVQFNLVRDALRERAILLRIAPHLCHRLPLVIPLYRYPDIPYFAAGLKLYDLLAGSFGIGASRLIGKEEVLRRFPTLRREGLKGGILFYDGQFNDARMNVALALTALEHGAALANYLEVVRLLREGDRVAGAQVREVFTGKTWEIRARCVVNACGPFSDHLRRMDDPDAIPLLRVSTGAHIALPRRIASGPTGVVIPRTDDGRVLFVLPWLEGCLVGTTDHPASPDRPPAVTEEEVAFLLRHLNRYLGEAVTPDEISSSWAGLRPLVRDPSTSDTANLARDHVINRSRSGLITITGGKWTTYRKMAQDTVDYAIGCASLSVSGECRTDRIMLHGAERYGQDQAASLAREYGLEPETAAHLKESYGDRAAEVAALCREESGARLAPGYPYLKGEVLYAVRRELALCAADVLARRVPLALLDIAAAKGAAATVVGLMARELGWDAERTAKERESLGEM